MNELILYCDDLNPQGRPVRLKKPSWETVETAIRKMDGKRFTEVFLTDSEDCSLCITGGCLNEIGSDRRFMCEKICDPSTSLLFRPSEKTDETVNILENGPKDFPEYWTVCLDSILKVAKTYWQTGELDSNFEWEE